MFPVSFSSFTDLCHSPFYIIPDIPPLMKKINYLKVFGFVSSGSQIFLRH